MTLKNFFKTNFTISLLIILSLVIIINNFSRFYRYNNAFEFDSRFSNYQGGFVRRGLPGEFFFQMYELFNMHPGWMIFIFVCILYFLFYLFFFHLVKKIKLDKFFTFAIFSPIAFYFPVLNNKATGHKEIIFLCFFSIFCFFLPKMKKLHANYLMILITLFVGLSHEGLIFYSMYLIIPFLLIFNFKSFKEILFNLTPLLSIILILFFLIYYFKGTDQHVIDICDSVKNYVNSECKNSGQIALIASSFEQALAWKKVAGIYEGTHGVPLYPKYFIIYGTGFVLGFLPLAILYGKSKLIKFPINLLKVHPLVFLFFPLLTTAPIYYIAFDWGRYLYISYMSSLIILIFCLRNDIFYIRQKNSIIKDNIFVKFLFITSIIIYGFGWTVPICCELNFKSGISGVIERVVYYYNPLFYQ